MINITTIKTDMLGVNGWKQSLLSGAPVIDATNLATTSGALYNQDFSALVTVDNIINVYETDSLTDAQTNTLLNQIVEGSAAKVMNAIFSDDDFIENNLLFPYEYDFTHTLENDTSFVGYEITTPKEKDIINIINRISLTFNGIDTVKMLLFHSSKKAAVKEIEITTEVDNEVNKAVVDWVLPYSNSVNGGKWYLGYLRSGLTSEAYNRDFEYSVIQNQFCMSSYESIKVLGHDTETLFDVNNIDYTSDTYGINLDISAFKNYDSTISQNKNKFSKVMGLQVAATVLDMIANTTVSNVVERSVRQDALIQLNGFVSENIKTVGILAKLEKEIKNLKESFLGSPYIQTNTLK